MKRLKDYAGREEELYLDWFNNFVSIGAFAEHYEIEKHTANVIIEAGRHKNHSRNN